MAGLGMICTVESFHAILYQTRFVSLLLRSRSFCLSSSFICSYLREQLIWKWVILLLVAPAVFVSAHVVNTRFQIPHFFSSQAHNTPEISGEADLLSMNRLERVRMLKGLIVSIVDVRG